jgi:hypothetical protein
VKAVANDIAVRLSTTDERTDDDIAAAAVQALEWDALRVCGADHRRSGREQGGPERQATYTNGILRMQLGGADAASKTRSESLKARLMQAILEAIEREVRRSTACA